MAKYADITPFYEWLDFLIKEDKQRCPEYGTLMLYEIRDELDSLPELVHCAECTKSGCCIIEERLVTARAKDRYCGLGEE